MKRITLLLSLVGGVCCALVIYHVGNVSATATMMRQARPAKAVEGASNWVPFTATLTVSVDGDVKETGTFYRDSHGSTREERTAPGKPILITLNNRTTRTIYARGPSGVWRQMAMPPNMMIRGPVVLNRMAGLSDTPEELDGIRVHRYQTPDSLEWRAPDLNFFAVRKEIGAMVQVYDAIVRGEPSPALFLLPPNVKAVMVDSFDELSKLM